MSDAPITVSHSILRKLHRIHQQLHDLNEQVKRGPRQLAAGEAGVAAHQAELQTAVDTLKQAKMACDTKQLQLKEREQHLTDLGAKLNGAASNREFQLIKDQIAADRQANEVLSDEILEAFERIDELTANVSTKESEVAQKQADHATFAGDVESKMSGLAGEIERVSAELSETEKGLPASVKEMYERLIRNHGEDGLSPVEDSSCGNCGSTFAPQAMNRLMLSHFVCCPSCGAILYLAEDE